MTVRSHSRLPSRRIDKVMVALIIILAAAGLGIVYEASVAYAFRVFGDKYHFFFLQAGWMFLGFVGMLILSKVSLGSIAKISPWFFGISIFFLLFVLISTPFAPQVYGARRWLIINPSPLPEFPLLGRIGFQPSELVKLSGIIFVSAMLSSAKMDKSKKWVSARNLFVVVLLVSAIVAAEPNFTTAFVIMLIFLSIYFISDPYSILYLIMSLPVIGIIVSVYIFSAEYRKARIIALIKPDSVDSTGLGYQIKQIMIALGSGGFFGLGLGQSRQKYSYLPEVTADSIFAIIGEEFGFIGTTLILALFVSIIWRGLLLAERCKDKFNTLLITGVTMWIAVQTLINLGAMVRILPITGIPLPLISYGGSSTVFIMWGLGLLLNASRNVEVKEEK
ncbi:hypothetical protein A2982_01155 [candidate division WWE3 bacterium RIFCSPLOWO2_01_FULL_39_13]|uniref:Probable peptidoglycan glycosyltransferase FtsW n=1 Tax=candidate division WWE3 bacterium RIFCSPLOWO2_01_FULL_39_13 TaxID=1802624 RepID=A0A1F4V2E7_UNCKA|nr:MAG: hypothetical protein A2982_01155 [candidate division WWE3 bacterium RIFCSPLOWO2_01_FULL_39_13]